MFIERAFSPDFSTTLHLQARIPTRSIVTHAASATRRGVSERIAFWLRVDRVNPAWYARSQHYSILHIKSNLVKRDIEESETRASYPRTPLPLFHYACTQGGQNYSIAMEYFARFPFLLIEYLVDKSREDVLMLIDFPTSCE